MKLQEIPDFRATAMTKFCESQAIKDLLTNTENSSAAAGDLIMHNIFPYAHVPGTSTTARTYITMELFVPRVQNKTFKQVRLVYYVFSHETLISVADNDSGKMRLRHDLIAQEIDSIMNGSRDFGLGRLSLANTADFSPIENYYGVVLTYDADEFNR